MTGAVGLADPDNPADAPLETEGVGEDPGAVPDPDEAMPGHQDGDDSKTPAVEDEPDADEISRGQYEPTADYGDE